MRSTVKLVYSFSVLTLILSLTLCAQFQPDTNTLALWHFDEASGNTVYDASVNDNDGWLSEPSARISDGRSGGALRLNGASEYIRVPHRTIQIPHLSFTIEASIRVLSIPSTPSSATILNKGIGNDGVHETYALRLLSSGKLHFFSESGTTCGGTFASGFYLTSKSILNTNQWYDIAAIHDGATNTAKLYINGILDTLTDAHHVPQDCPLPIMMGADSLDQVGRVNFFHGDIDEVRISNVARTFQLTPDANTVALWRFDEESGTTVSDASGNDNTGTVNGTVSIVPGLFGNARKFTGNNWIDFGNAASLQLTTEFTVEAFVKVDSLPTSWGYIAGKYDGSTGDVTSNFQLAIMASGAIEFKVGSNTYTLRSKGVIPIGTWVHVAGTYDATLPSANMKIYIAGVLDTTMDRTGSAPTNSSPLLVGLRMVDDNNCASCYHEGTAIDEVRISNVARLVSVEAQSSFIPAGYTLLQNYPNPFNPSTTIEFNLPVGSHIAIKIYDELGRLVRTLVNTEHVPGSHQVVWDGKDNAGVSVSSGTYFYQLKTDKFVQAKKMIYLR